MGWGFPVLSLLGHTSEFGRDAKHCFHLTTGCVSDHSLNRLEGINENISNLNPNTFTSKPPTLPPCASLACSTTSSDRTGLAYFSSETQDDMSSRDALATLTQCPRLGLPTKSMVLQTHDIVRRFNPPCTPNHRSPHPANNRPQVPG